MGMEYLFTTVLCRAGFQNPEAVTLVEGSDQDGSRLSRSAIVYIAGEVLGICTLPLSIWRLGWLPNLYYICTPTNGGLLKSKHI